MGRLSGTAPLIPAPRHGMFSRQARHYEGRFLTRRYLNVASGIGFSAEAPEALAAASILLADPYRNFNAVDVSYMMRSGINTFPHTFRAIQKFIFCRAGTSGSFEEITSSNTNTVGRDSWTRGFNHTAVPTGQRHTPGTGYHGPQPARSFLCRPVA